MWIQKRLDISWIDICKILLKPGFAGDRIVLEKKIAQEWSSNSYNIPFLCVRTGFDLLLRTLNFPSGSEVIISALNIPDMFKIIEHNNLKIVPVDISMNTLEPDLDAIKRNITDKTKAIIVVNLFGTKINIGKIKNTIGTKDILLIEDCAQLFTNNKLNTTQEADVRMFSFGTIKSGTAFGGGIFSFKNKDLQQRIDLEHKKYPVQKNRIFVKKIIKVSVLKFLSGRINFGILYHLANFAGKDIDKIAYKSTKGFKGNIFEMFRFQPSRKLMKALYYRIKTYDYKRLEKNIADGKKMAEIIKNKYTIPGIDAEYYNYWVFPILSDDVKNNFKQIREKGFFISDQHGVTSYNHFKNTEYDLQNSDKLISEIVFLPFYVELPTSSKNKLANAVVSLS